MASKKSLKPKNPFVSQGYISPEYFCDRQEETDLMLNHFENGRNITLVSPRRIGKTGLIKNLFYHIERQDRNAICLYLDIYATKNLQDFTEMFGSVVFNGFARKEKSFMQKAATLLGSLRPVFTTDPYTGMPKMMITVDASQSQLTIQQIFELLAQSRREVYIAIDEFQQIANYPETGTEAMLRSHIQFATNVHFIFAGSKYRLMAEMFGSPQRPFFQSTEMMDLQPLDKEVYYQFANNFFEKKRGSLDHDIFMLLYDRFEGHTWYIQSVLNRLYDTCLHVRGIKEVNRETVHLVESRSPQYESLAQFLSSNQFNLLKAIASEGVVKEPTGSRFIREHNMASASIVQSALRALVEKEIVYRTPRGYIVYDRFMSIWLARTFG
ncbi:MAG: ATP-binding protein [Muribaculaceae bacterium]|nr:ATP-binding protein [Muribaculaceae bacterium]